MIRHLLCLFGFHEWLPSAYFEDIACRYCGEVDQ